jgi:hypothetical protein
MKWMKGSTWEAIVPASLIAFFATTIPGGCGSSLYKPDPVEVWGRVTFNRKPVTGGAIVFLPEDQGPNWAAGLIHADGSYHISAIQLDTPLKPGNYHVFLRPPPPWASAIGQQETADRKGEVAALNAPLPVSLTPAPDQVPAIFRDSHTSPLHVKLDGRPARVDIHLKD